MKYIKEFANKYFAYFTYFYAHLRHRLLLTLALSLLVGVLDGFGLAMFLPLLQVADGQTIVDAEAMGNLRFLVDFLKALDVELNVYSVLLVILFFFILKGAAKFSESFYRVIVRQFFISKIRFDSIDELSQYSYKSFVLSDSGRIQNTLSGEVTRVAQTFHDYMAMAQAVVMVLVYVFLAILSNPAFAVLVAIGGLLSNLAYRQIYRRTKAASKRITNDGHRFQGLLIQKVAFFKYLKATGLIATFSAKLKDYIKRIEESNRKIGYYGSIVKAAREPLIVTVVVGVIMIQVTFFSQSIGVIILSLMFFYRSLTFVMVMQTSWNSFLTNSGALENMTEFIAELRAGRENYGHTEVADLRKAIELKDVSFRYGEKMVLSRINLRIEKNETVALVGQSGSGKTTLVNIISGLMPVEFGSMTFDGIETKEINLVSWQRQLGYITQEPVIFADTIFNNVTFWDERTVENSNRFWRALEKASIADFVRELPMQEDSNLGAGGILVSGGQKQRLSIARELYKNVSVLIMDEATSALDSGTEQEIQQNIAALKGEYTIIIVAHRLATVKTADRIVLMNNGEITDEGDFNSLLTSSEAFNRMVTLQEL